MFRRWVDIQFAFLFLDVRVATSDIGFPVVRVRRRTVKS